MQFFIQMSGVPGAGKTTVATALGQRLGAVVIDHDVTKSALLAAQVPADIAGGVSYAVLNALARHLLSQGHSVIFDSPCLYAELLQRGQHLAQEAGAAYRYIECVVNDIAELDRRLRSRERMPSQVAGVWSAPTAGSGKTQTGEQMFRDWMANMKRPAMPFLVLDTMLPHEHSIATALAYVFNQHEPTP